jgi:hypothetical protein
VQRRSPPPRRVAPRQRQGLSGRLLVSFVGDDNRTAEAASGIKNPLAAIQAGREEHSFAHALHGASVVLNVPRTEAVVAIDRVPMTDKGLPVSEVDLIAFWAALH